MVDFDKLFKLLGCDREKTWSDTLFLLANSYGFSQLFYSINVNKQAPLASAAVYSNCSPAWLQAYEDTFYSIDPVVEHCFNSALPLVWERETYKTYSEKQLYEVACSHGIRQGIAFPVHGTNAEFGLLNLVIDDVAYVPLQRDLDGMISDWALIRDYVFESSKRFSGIKNHKKNTEIRLTPRELECLKWAAEGKSSWDISNIFKCAEATVNFHFSNIHHKFEVNTRQQAIVKAMQLGLIFPRGNN